MTSQNAKKGPRTPAGLKARGRAFWRDCTREFEFSDAESALLEEVCRCLDRLDLLDSSIAEFGAMVDGSKGQQVVNPALTEARGQQAILHRLVAALKLPDSDGEPIPTGRTIGAQAAAATRWTGTRRGA
jgi:hypothetical protein